MRRLLVAVTLVLAGGCSGNAEEKITAQPGASPTFRRAPVIIETDDGSVLVNAEVADTPERTQLGLMHRTELADDAGMVFLFFQDTASGFWMKNTLIPLSIAFFDERGKIVAILDMEPCSEEQAESEEGCPIYNPGATYRGALEVNQGAFDGWGVEIGDIVRVSP